MSTPKDFADYCCELLIRIGPCSAKRMFSGWGLSLDGLNVAIVVDLGAGDTLWLKADDSTRSRFEAAGCTRFSYGMRRGDTVVERSMNYYAAPEDAMDSPDAMAPWARMALASALAARAAKVPRKGTGQAAKTTKTPTTVAKKPPARTTAPAAARRATAPRRSGSQG